MAACACRNAASATASTAQPACRILTAQLHHIIARSSSSSMLAGQPGVLRVADALHQGASLLSSLHTGLDQQPPARRTRFKQRCSQHSSFRSSLLAGAGDHPPIASMSRFLSTPARRCLLLLGCACRRACGRRLSRCCSRLSCCSQARRTASLKQSA